MRIPISSYRNNFWSIADQSVVSGGNFLTQIVLARNLLGSDYGTFALLYGAIMLVLNNCHSSLVTYPLSVQGAHLDITGLKAITASSLALTAFASVFQVPVILIGAIALKHGRLALVVLFALLCWQLQETARRALMAHLRHRGAIAGDALSYLGQSAVLAIFAFRGSLSLSTAFLAMALTSLAAGVLQAAQLGLSRVSPRGLSALVRTYWRLGRWALLANVTNSATVACFPWTLGLSAGLPEAASFQALGNVLGLSHPLMTGVSNVIIPAASRARRASGVRAAMHSAIRLSTQGALCIAPYFAILLFVPDRVLGLFYGHASAFSRLGTSLRWFVLAYVFVYVFTVLGAFLNGLERPALMMVGGAVGLAALFLGIPLAIEYGVPGAAAGLALVAFLRLVAMAILSRRFFRGETLLQILLPSKT
jgi:O-antigen/teichoic acid export membrane protein